MNKILVNVGNVYKPGGVSALYRILDLEEESIKYFDIFQKGNNRIFSIKILRLATNFIRFHKLIKDFDLVLINPSFKKNAFIRDSLFSIIAKMNKKKLISFWHGWDNVFENKVKNSHLMNCLFKVTYGKADGHIVLGSVFKNKLINLGIHKSKKFLLFHNVAENQYLDEFNINHRLKKKKDFNILYISRIEKNKGARTAINTFEILKKKYPHLGVNLRIAGDGKELNNVKKYAKSKGINDIYFLGYVKGYKKHLVFMESDLLFFPTEYGEGLPLSVLEGMAYGLPIVTKRVGGLKDIIKDGVNGFLINSTKNSEMYFEAIEKIILNNELYNEISIKNYRFAENYLMPNKAKQQLKGFLHCM